MKTLKLTMAMGMGMGMMLVVGSTFASGTFGDISFDTPIYSDTDPLGVQAIQEADTKATNAATVAGEAANVASNALTIANEATTTASNAVTIASEASTAAETAQSKANVTEAKVTAIETTIQPFTNSVTKSGDIVVIGSMKGTLQDVGLLAGTNSIVMAVDRDSDGINPEDGQILLAADKITFDSPLSGIFFGNTSLESLLSDSGQGEINKIVTVKTNGVAMVPDSSRAIDIIIPDAGEGNVIEVVKTNGAEVAIIDKTVDITIPAPGEVNAIQSISTNGAPVEIDKNRNVNIVIPTYAGGDGVIESITTNGVALPINGKTIELPNYVLMSDLEEGIEFDTMSVSNLTINGKRPSLEGHTHPELDGKIDSATNTLYEAITNEFVRMEDLQDGIEFDTMVVSNLLINGKQPSLEGHTHTNLENVIESITTNGVALPVNGKTIELPNYVLMEDLQEGIEFDTMVVSNLLINGKKPSLEGHTHTNLENIIEGITVNGDTVAPDANKIVALTIPDAGQSNIVETIKVNGTALTPDSNKSVDITIPSAGDVNIIEKVKVNGSELTPDANKAVDITVPSIDGKLDVTNGVAFMDFKVYPTNEMVGISHLILTHESMSIGDVGGVEYKENEITHNGESYEFSSDTNGLARLKDIPTISTNGVTITPDTSKNVNIVIPAPGEDNKIETIMTNGVAVAISNKKVDIAIPTVPDISGLATKQEVSGLTITTAKVTDLDSYKNPTISAAALDAINGINNAQDIATIKASLTNFLHQFVIPAP